MKHHHLFAAAVGFLVGAITLALSPVAHAAAPPVETIYFDTVVISVDSKALEACDVQRQGAHVIVPAPCRVVAASMRRAMCGNNGLDADAEFMCPKEPTLTTDFVVDGQSWFRV